MEWLCLSILFYILATVHGTGGTILDVVDFAGDTEYADIRILDKLIFDGTSEFIAKQSDVTRWWAATNAINKYGMNMKDTLARFNIDSTTYRLPKGCADKYLGYYPEDDHKFRLRVLLADVNKQAYRSNFEELYIRESDDE